MQSNYGANIKWHKRWFAIISDSGIFAETNIGICSAFCTANTKTEQWKRRERKKNNQCCLSCQWDCGVERERPWEKLGEKKKRLFFRGERRSREQLSSETFVREQKRIFPHIKGTLLRGGGGYRREKKGARRWWWRVFCPFLSSRIKRREGTNTHIGERRHAAPLLPNNGGKNKVGTESPLLLLFLRLFFFLHLLLLFFLFLYLFACYWLRRRAFKDPLHPPPPPLLLLLLWERKTDFNHQNRFPQMPWNNNNNNVPSSSSRFL